jgi:hypothetical protein
VTSCGHSFCRACISEWMKVGPGNKGRGTPTSFCPVCR